MAIDGNGEHDDHYILVIDSRFQIIQPALLTSQKSQPKPTTHDWCHQSSCFFKRSSSCLVCLEVPQLEMKAEAGQGTVPSNPGPERRLSNSTRKANLTIRHQNPSWVGVFLAKKKQIQTGHQNWLGMPGHKKYSLIMNHTFIINICVTDIYIYIVYTRVCMHPYLHLVYTLCIFHTRIYSNYVASMTTTSN